MNHLLLSWTLVAIILVGGAAPSEAKHRRNNLTGVADVLIKEPRNSKKAQPKWLLKLRLQTGKVLNTNVNPTVLTRLYTGQRIRVSGSFGQSQLKDALAGTKSLVIDIVDPIDPLVEVPPDVEIIPDGVGQDALPFSAYVPLKSSLKTLTIPIKAEWDNGTTCPTALTIPYTLAGLRTFLLTRSAPGTIATLPDAYDSWSQGLTVIDLVNSKVTDFVTLPCIGNASTGSYTSWADSGCAYSTWTPFVETAVAQMGYNLSKYDLIQYLFPQTAQVCVWVGMGQLGCVTQGKCKQWLSAKQWSKYELWGHEQAHAFSINHAQKGTNAEGDTSGVMGACCTFRRQNTVHAWQLGWQNVYQLTGVELPAGDSLILKLLPQSVKGSKGVRLVPTWATSVMPFYLGFRDGVSTDIELAANYKFKVNIYQSAIAFQQDAKMSYYVTALDGTTTLSYSDATSGLTFRWLNGSASQAYISICRFGGSETQGSCCDGRDSDCNGLGGAADGSCSAFMGACSVARVFTIRQDVYITGTSCSDFNATVQAAFLSAATTLSGYSDISMDCAYAGNIGGGRLRIAIMINTTAVPFGPARALAESFNMAVYTGTFASLVKLPTLNPRTGDGFCLRADGVDWTPCPPATPVQTKSNYVATATHAVALHTLKKLRYAV